MRRRSTVQPGASHDSERLVENQPHFRRHRAGNIERDDPAPLRHVSRPIDRESRNLRGGVEEPRDERSLARLHGVYADVEEKADPGGETRDPGHVQRAAFVNVRQEFRLDIVC